MKIEGNVAVVTGGASGLGKATVELLIQKGMKVTVVDLPESSGADLAESIGSSAKFVAADVTSADQVQRALDEAESMGSLRALVHCAGRGGAQRILDKDGQPGSLEHYASIVNLNLVGTFNVLRLCAARMARNAEIDGERGVCVLTASVAAFEGQIGQLPYASSKAGVVGMTLVAARDLASRLIRVCTIAPGLFDTPILARLPEEVRASLGKSVPHPARLGYPEEYAKLVRHILENPMLNGETIRLDGAIRMGPK